LSGIAHLTAVGATAAGVVPFDMHRFLLDAGHDSRIITTVADGSDPRIHGFFQNEEALIRYGFRRKVLRKIWGARRFRGRRDPDYTFDVYAEETYYPTRWFLDAIPDGTQSIVVHFCSSFINTVQLAEISQKKNATLFWLMMDMATLTGGCHYAWDCNGYEAGCGNCPALYSDNPEDISREHFAIKEAALDGVDVQIIAASEWQYRQAKSSRLFRNRPVHKILTAVDPEIHHPGSSQEARRSLDLPENSLTILFGAYALNERRKGMLQFTEMLQALHDLLDQDTACRVMILLVGSGDASKVEAAGWPVRHFGVVRHETMAEIYRASTVYVCASIEDSGPTMINQAVMSGVPVVSFDMGVAFDLVINNVTGYRIGISDINGMSMRVKEILSFDDNHWTVMSTACRQLALEKLHPSNQLNELSQLLP
jgi:glycosyltransferase involved in cell wall biosynthesis